MINGPTLPEAATVAAHRACTCRRRRDEDFAKIVRSVGLRRCCRIPSHRDDGHDRMVDFLHLCRFSSNLSSCHYLVVDVSLSHYLVAQHASKTDSSGSAREDLDPYQGCRLVESDLGNLDGNVCSPLASVPTARYDRFPRRPPAYVRKSGYLTPANRRNRNAYRCPGFSVVNHRCSWRV